MSRRAAIKFLHTADLHLGKNFHEYSLLEDQAFMLEKLERILSDPSYAALIIAGDVFDRSIPPQEAVELFGGFLGRLKTARPGLAVLVIPGNHDSASRLGYGRELFAGMGVHIARDEAGALRPVMVESGGQSCACFLLPFLYSPAFRGLAEESAAALEAARQKAVSGGADFTLLAAHLFCRGGQGAGSERNFLGQTEQVDPALFAGFDYVALGHLHRPQKAAANAWYAGSPLAYSFDEAGAEKCFLSVELSRTPRTDAELPLLDGEQSNAEVKALPVVPFRSLARLEGPFSRFLKDNGEELKKAENCFLEINLTGSELTENALPILRRRFPFLLMVRQDQARSALNAGIAPERNAAGRTDLDDFQEFLRDIYGELDQAGSEKLETFAEILRCIKEET